MNEEMIRDFTFMKEAFPEGFTPGHLYGFCGNTAGRPEEFMEDLAEELALDDIKVLPYRSSFMLRTFGHIPSLNDTDELLSLLEPIESSRSGVSFLVTLSLSGEKPFNGKKTRETIAALRRIAEEKQLILFVCLFSASSDDYEKNNVFTGADPVTSEYIHALNENGIAAVFIDGKEGFLDSLTSYLLPELFFPEKDPDFSGNYELGYCSHCSTFFELVFDGTFLRRRTTT